MIIILCDVKSTMQFIRDTAYLRLNNNQTLMLLQNNFSNSKHRDQVCRFERISWGHDYAIRRVILWPRELRPRILCEYYSTRRDGPNIDFLRWQVQCLGNVSFCSNSPLRHTGGLSPSRFATILAHVIIRDISIIGGSVSVWDAQNQVRVLDLGQSLEKPET